MILIKKYPNRRLYDTSKSQYINLETIKELVMLHKEFRVIDSKTEDDLTKSILLQIITEQEGNDQQAILTQTVLKQLIRFYGSDMQSHMRQYIEQSISLFLDRQDALQNVMTDFLDKTSPMNVFNQFVENNMSMWRNFAQGDGVPPNPFNYGAPSQPKPANASPTGEQEPSPDSEDEPSKPKEP